MNDFMYRFFNSPWVTTREYPLEQTPQMDIVERSAGYEIAVAAPGANADINVSVEDTTLNIDIIRDTSGEDIDNVGVDEILSSHKGIRDYAFNRKISLEKASIATDKITSAYKNGILTITLPKSETAQPKKIDVKVE
mgnify:CR=1 FL=1|tara:strand:+ start:79 stop:489 length:411 start_codon:yes stop_codon:yes gene_type:complete